MWQLHAARRALRFRKPKCPPRIKDVPVCPQPIVQRLPFGQLRLSSAELPAATSTPQLGSRHAAVPPARNPFSESHLTTSWALD